MLIHHLKCREEEKTNINSHLNWMIEHYQRQKKSLYHIRTVCSIKS